MAMCQALCIHLPTTYEAPRHSAVRTHLLLPGRLCITLCPTFFMEICSLTRIWEAEKPADTSV